MFYEKVLSVLGPNASTFVFAFIPLDVFCLLLALILGYTFHITMLLPALV